MSAGLVDLIQGQFPVSFSCAGISPLADISENMAWSSGQPFHGYRPWLWSEKGLTDEQPDTTQPDA
ncbi:hypothetical protein QNM99_01840 [Pseudomonas sp. PCH446]